MIGYANNRDTPLVGAKVQLIPATFLAGAIQTGEGVTTNDRGIAKPMTMNPPPGPPGVEFRLYRVAITHEEVNIPARYTTQTQLGFELSPLERDRDTAEFQPRRC